MTRTLGSFVKSDTKFAKMRDSYIELGRKMEKDVGTGNACACGAAAVEMAGDLLALTDVLKSSEPREAVGKQVREGSLMAATRNVLRTLDVYEKSCAPATRAAHELRQDAFRFVNRPGSVPESQLLTTTTESLRGIRTDLITCREENRKPKFQVGAKSK